MNGYQCITRGHEWKAREDSPAEEICLHCDAYRINERLAMAEKNEPGDESFESLKYLRLPPRSKEKP